MEASKGAKRSLSCAALVRSSRHGLFGVLFVTSKRIHSTRLMAAVALLVQLAQMLSFVLSTPALAVNWRASLLPVKVLASVSNPRKFIPFGITPTTLVGMYWAAVAWTVFFLALLLHGMSGFIRNEFSMLWPLRALRLVGQLSTSILFIPIVTVLMSPFTCSEEPASLATSDDFWANAGFSCNGAPMIVFRAISSVLVAALIFMCCVFAVAFFDSAPLSRNPLARAHGRGELVNLIISVILVLVINIFGPFLASWLLVATLYASGFIWLGSTLLFMPFYSHFMNQATSASAAVFTFAVVCLTLNLAYPGTDAAVTLYVGAPLAAIMGVWLADVRMWRIVRTPPVQLASAYEIELKARYALHSALWGHPTDEHAIISTADTSSSSAATAQDVDAADDDETRVETLRKRVPANVVAEVHAMYRAAAARFRGSAILHVFFARFYSVWQANKHMQMSHLLQAERRSPPLDVSFLVFQARKLAESSGAGGNVTALNRVSFEKYAADARRCVIKSANKQAQFWAELLEAQPDLTRLHRLSTEMNSAINEAEHAFSQLFVINPQSLVVMRLYAAFNMLVTCNGDKASVLLAEADRIEDQRSKEHRHESSGKLQLLDESALDILADNTAVFTIGGLQRNLGQILSVNSAACKLVGFSRLQLERRIVFTLLPRPLDAFHEAALKQYVGTGEGRIVDYNLVTLALKAGIATPVLMCVRETPPEDGNSTFIVLMREVRIDTQVILLNAAFSITAATALSAEALGMDTVALSNDTPISDFVADWNNVLTQLQTGASVAICFESQRAGGSGDGLRAQSVSRARVAKTAQRTDSGDEGGLVALQSDASTTTWVRATLQTVHTGGGIGTFYALHWTPIKSHRAASIVQAMMAAAPQQFPVVSASPAGHAPAAPSTARSAFPAQPQASHTKIDVMGLAETDASESNDDARDAIEDALFSPSQVQLPGAVDMVSPMASASDPTSRPARSNSSDSNAPVADEERALPLALAPRVTVTTPARRSSIKASQPIVRSRAGSVGGPASATLHDQQGSQSQREASAAPRRDADAASRRDETASRPDGGSSVGSKSSSTSKAMTRLRRALAEPDQHLLPGLRYLRVVGVVITLLAIGLAAANTIITNTALAEYTGNLRYVVWGSKRMVASFDAIIAIQDLVYMARGYTPYDNATEASLRSYIRGNASYFASLHRSMYAAVLGTVTQDEYTKSYITVRRFDTPAAAASPFGAVQTANLYAVGNDFVTFSTQLSYQPLSNLSDPLNPILQYVLLNDMPLGNAHELLHRSLELGYSMSLTTEQIVSRNQTIIYGSMMSILVFIALAVFLPILCVVERAKDVISIRFVELPLQVRQTVYLQALRRLRTLKRNYVSVDGDEDEEMGESEDSDDERRAAGGGGDNSHRDGLDVEAALGDDDEGEDASAVDWNALLRGAGTKSPASRRIRASSSRSSLSASRKVAPAPIGSSLTRTTSRRPTKQQYRKSPIGFALLVLRFVGPLLALMVFFSTSYAVSYSTLGRVSTTSAVVTAALERATCSRECIMDVRRLLDSYGDRSYVVTQHSGMQDTGACVIYNQQLLAFGTNEEPRGDYALHTVPVETGAVTFFDAGMTTSIYNALFSNACPYIVASTAGQISMERCSSFNSGIFTQGLVAAENEYYNRLMRLADRRLRSRTYKVGSAPGAVYGKPVGIVISASMYNYTQDSCDVMNCLTAANYDLTGVALPLGPMPDPFYRGDILPNATVAPASYIAPYSIVEELQSADMQTVIELESKYHGPAVNAIATAYNDAVMGNLAMVITFQTAFVVVFVTLFVVFQLLVFLPNVATVNRDIQAKRAMLLYLPPEIVSRVRVIRALVDDILRSDAAGVTDASGVSKLRGARAQKLSSSTSAGMAPSSADEGGPDTDVMTAGAAEEHGGAALSRVRSFHAAPSHRRGGGTGSADVDV